MNILILTGKFGMGHFSAAQSIKDQLSKECPNINTYIEDFFEYSLDNLSKPLYKGFSLLVSRASFFYNAYYNITQNLEHIDIDILFPIFSIKFEELLNKYSPEAIIVTHPFCGQIVSQYKSLNNIQIPLITCITDMSSHIEWLSPETNCYLVGSNDVSKKLQEKGIDVAKIHVTGIPVKSEFKDLSSKTNTQKKHLLIMGGGLGLIPTEKTFFRELERIKDLEVTIIVGNNKKLYNKLVDKYTNIEVVGYVNDVYRYMANSDLLLTKPGGITISEAIFSELPLIIWAPFLQQEINNAQFLISSGLGVEVKNNYKDCLNEIKRLLSDPNSLLEMKNKMSKMKENFTSSSLSEIIGRI